MVNLVCLPRTLVTKDRKSTRLNSSHVAISYAVFCLKKKKLSAFHRQPASRKFPRPISSTPRRSRPLRCYESAAAACGLPSPDSLVDFFFFFKEPGPPRILPLSPPGPPPD